MRRAVVLGLLVVAVSACGSTGRGPTLAVRPNPSVEDQPVAVEATGFEPNERVTLTLRSTDVKGVRFAAHATYLTGKDGTIDLARAAPLKGGSYTGHWAMGLLASLTGTPASAYYFWSSKPRAFRLTASVAGRVRASTMFTRRWSAVRYSQQKLTVAKDGIDGTFFAPVGARHRAAVLAFGGSEGGDDGGFTGGRLAAHGIPTLFIGYFHAPGVPDRLFDIPLEYFHRALSWLDRQREVDPTRVSLVTGSYGSEAALLLGVHYPGQIHKIVATVPSSVVTCGFAGAHRGGSCLGSPWTFAGHPVPYSRLFDETDPFDDPQAAIPVEQIHAKLMLACGGEDITWTSCPYARAIVARRRKAGEQTTLYVYPRAGHFVGSPSFAYAPGAMYTDTSVPWTERGREDLWPRVVAFVRS